MAWQSLGKCMRAIDLVVPGTHRGRICFQKSIVLLGPWAAHDVPYEGVAHGRSAILGLYVTTTVREGHF